MGLIAPRLQSGDTLHLQSHAAHPSLPQHFYSLIYIQLYLVKVWDQIATKLRLHLLSISVSIRVRVRVRVRIC